MKRIIKLTESDLTRIVKRVIVEQPTEPQKCSNNDLNLIPKIIQRNADLTLIFNELASNVVTVISKDAEINCGCKKDELMQYLK
jgi:hypothetical protein